MDKRLIIIFFLLFLSINCIGFARSQNAVVTVNTKHLSEHKINREIFGIFVEFVEHHVNSPRGLYSEELLNRGLDLGTWGAPNLPFYWEKFTESSAVDAWWQFSGDKYNPASDYSFMIQNKNGAGRAGLSQSVHLCDSVTHIFYIYFKGESADTDLYLTVKDYFTGEIRFEKSLGIPDKNTWQRSEIKLPVLKGLHKAEIILSFGGNGYVILDEASLMPANNVLGVRKEFYEMLKELNCGSFRYPGGCFADSQNNKLQNAVGDKDLRRSPNMYYDGRPQRMDFGVDEFLRFCKILDIEPHITVNFQNGSPQEASTWLRYCNASSNDFYGAMRAENGHPEPYNVKYWEIGNEQWGFESEMAVRYLEYYDLLKSIDHSLNIMIDGNHWEGYKNFSELMSVTGKKCQVYGFHPARGPLKNEDNDSLAYLAIAGSPHDDEKYLRELRRWLKDWDLYPNVKAGWTEWWSTYGTLDDWMLDTNFKNSSMESAVWNAGMLNTAVRNSDIFVLGQRTLMFGIAKCAIKEDTGERIFYKTPSFHAFSLLSRHTGIRLAETFVNCSKYSVQKHWYMDIPALDIIATADPDTLFISVVNRSASDTFRLLLDLDRSFASDSIVEYRLHSAHYLDANTPDNPENITPKTIFRRNNGHFEVPPHSLTIFAFPFPGLINTTEPVSPENIELLASPNPFDEYITVEHQDYFDYGTEISLIDLTGRIVKRIKRLENSDCFTIPTGDISRGAYVLIFKSGGEIKRKMLIKK